MIRHVACAVIGFAFGAEFVLGVEYPAKQRLSVDELGQVCRALNATLASDRTMARFASQSEDDVATIRGVYPSPAKAATARVFADNTEAQRRLDKVCDLRRYRP